MRQIGHVTRIENNRMQQLYCVYEVLYEKRRRRLLMNVRVLKSIVLMELETGWHRPKKWKGIVIEAKVHRGLSVIRFIVN